MTARTSAVAVVISAGIALIVLIATLMGRPGSDSAADEAPAPVVEISATELLAAYESDESAADRRFKDRHVIVAGEVEQIGRDMRRNAYLLLEAKGHFFGVQLLFPASAETGVAGKSKGDYVRVRCRVNGKRGSVIARDCALLP